MILVVVLLGIGLGVQGAAIVKDKPAAGYGAPAQDLPYYPQAPPPNYVPIPVLVPPPPPPLISTHVCAWNVGFATYGGKRHRSRRPTERSCDDVFMPYGSGGKKKQAMANCDRCCKSTARLNGFSINSIQGFIVIDDQKRRCTCCAPALPTAYNYPATPSIGYGALPADSVQPVADYNTPPQASPPATTY